MCRCGEASLIRSWLYRGERVRSVGWFYVVLSSLVPPAERRVKRGKEMAPLSVTRPPPFTKTLTERLYSKIVCVISVFEPLVIM